MFWGVQGEPEGGLSPPDLQSGQLAQPQALASRLATQRWPQPWPWKPAEQALAWGSPCLGITGNAQPGQRATGLRKGGSFLSADGINMIQHKEPGGRALPPGSAPCCHLSGGPRRHLPRGPHGAHGGRAPCHSSLQEHHCLAGCQEQPSPVDRAPGNPTKRKQTHQISRPHPWAWQVSPGVRSPDPRACWGHTKTACPWCTTDCSLPQPAGVNRLPGTEVAVGVSTLRKCGT